jgi:DME family drug/metabolite transporter
MPRNGTPLLVLAGVLWGTGGLAGSVLASYTGLAPVSVAAYRLLTGGALVTGYALVRRRLVGLPREPQGLIRIATAGLLLACYQAAYFAAVAATSVGLATLTTMVAVPVLITAGTALLDRRRPTRRAIVSLLIALAGPRAAIIALLLEPLTATLLAALVNQEHLSGAQMLGALLILSSTAIRQDSTA